MPWNLNVTKLEQEQGFNKIGTLRKNIRCQVYKETWLWRCICNL